jgi:hypothetical protein
VGSFSGVILSQDVYGKSFVFIKSLFPQIDIFIKYKKLKLKKKTFEV